MVCSSRDEVVAAGEESSEEVEGELVCSKMEVVMEEVEESNVEDLEVPVSLTREAVAEEEV